MKQFFPGWLALPLAVWLWRNAEWAHTHDGSWLPGVGEYLLFRGFCWLAGFACLICFALYLNQRRIGLSVQAGLVVGILFSGQLPGFLKGQAERARAALPPPDRQLLAINLNDGSVLSKVLLPPGFNGEVYCARGGRVFLISGSNLLAYRGDKQQWRCSLSTRNQRAGDGPVCDEKFVFVTGTLVEGGKTQLLALSQTDGKVGWSVPVEWNDGLAGLAGEVVILNKSRGLAGYHAATGKQSWEIKTLSGQSCVGPGVVAIEPEQGGEFTLVDPLSGKSTRVATGLKNRGMCLRVRGDLVVGKPGSQLFAYDWRQRKFRWRVNAGSTAYGLCSDQSTIYASGSAWELASGRMLGAFPLENVMAWEGDRTVNWGAKVSVLRAGAVTSTLPGQLHTPGALADGVLYCINGSFR